jgi:hypothetical protein
MVNDPIRLRILQAIATRLQAITEPAGWWTNVGEAVFLGFAPALGEDDPPEAVAIVPAADVQKSNLAKKSLTLTVDIHVLVRLRDRCWDRVERARADVMRAMESGDRRLGGLAVSHVTYEGTTMLPLESGGLDTGLIVTYAVPYTESWGDPASV